MKTSTSICAGLVVSLLLFSASAAMGQDQSETHLGIRSRNIVHLVTTNCVHNDNTSATYSYDRDPRAPFAAVPKGFSFVITDIIIDPFCLTEPNDTDRFFVVVTVGQGRTFTAGFVGAETKHYALAGGLVIPEGENVDARNLPSSSNLVDVELIGYFVRGRGLGVGQPFSPPK